MKTQTPHSEITVAQLFEAYYDCRKRKRNTASALAFEIDLEANLMGLYAELISGSWEPSPATVFVVTKPKPREVWAAAFRDRIVHHLVYRAIGPIFERAFIHNTCACIKGRGTLFGANRLDHHLRSVTENWTKLAFVLKADIANFFGSIRQDALFAALSRRVTDRTMLDLCGKLVFQDVKRDALIKSTPSELALVAPHKSLFRADPGVGLPIGNLSSQFFANVLLDDTDQMVKRKLHMKHYIRYVDDMVVIHESAKTLLEAADAIRDSLGRIGLKLAEGKTFISPTDRGVDFVGTVIRPHRKSGRPKTFRNAIRALETAPQADLLRTTNSYLGLYRHAGNQAQRATIGRIAKQRGLWVAADLSKTASGRV